MTRNHSDARPPPSDASGPHVGIYWLVPDETGRQVLVTDTVPLDAAETYGDFLIFPDSHYDVWTRWQHLGPRWLKARGWRLTILNCEYEACPRGRAVYNLAEGVFWLYCDVRLQNPVTVATIKDALRLNGEVCIVKSDEHYR